MDWLRGRAPEWRWPREERVCVRAARSAKGRVLAACTFREAHSAVGKLVRESEAAGVEMQLLPMTSFTAAHPKFSADVMDALSAVNSVAQREAIGGTGPAAVRAQLETARTALLPPPTPRSSNAAG